MKNILKYYVRFLIVLMPLFFLPVVLDPMGFGKIWLMGISGLIGLVIWVVTLLTDKEAEVKLNKTFWLVLLLGVWSTISLLHVPVGVRMRSILGVNGWTMIMGMVVWWFLWLQVSDKEEGKKQLNWLTGAGLALVVLSLVVFLIPASKLPINLPKSNPILSINGAWSLTGSPLTEVILLLFLVLEWGRRLGEKLKAKSGMNYLVEVVILAVLMLGTGLDVFKVFKQGLALLDGISSWVIAAEVFKRSPLWGAGVGNFLEAFNLYRPASFNMTKYWANVFGGSKFGGLQLWTELGLPGLVWLFLLVTQWFKGNKKNFDFWWMGVALVLVLVGPLTMMGWWLLFWLLANKMGETKKVSLRLKVGEGFNAAPWVVAVVVIVVCGGGGYLWTRILSGEIYLRSSLVAAGKNDGGMTYNEQIKAIGADPWSAEYRRIYSQTNLALAKSLLANKDISEDDKQKAAVLVQQAVREGKSAVALDGLNASYWNNLAVIYRDLVGLVDGAADWSYQAYIQAVALDSTNPVLRLDLGGLLFAANRLEEADRMFEEVVVNKQDFANGWYNWAYTAKGMNKLDVAVQRMSQAVALVPVDSGDYEKASKELDVWKKELDEAIKKQQAVQQQQQPKQPETLKTPEPLPTASKEEKVNVPAADLEPPVVTVTPVASPTVTVAPANPTP